MSPSGHESRALRIPQLLALVCKGYRARCLNVHFPNRASRVSSMNGFRARQSLHTVGLPAIAAMPAYVTTGRCFELDYNCAVVHRAKDSVIEDAKSLCAGRLIAVNLASGANAPEN